MKIKAIEDNKKTLDNKQQGNNELLFSKERKIVRNTCNKRLYKIDQFSKKNYQGYLKFIVNSIGVETDFRELKDPEAFLGSIKKPEISLEETRYKQKQFRRYLKRIKTGNKSDKQKKTLANIKKFFDGRNDAIKFVGDYNDS